MSQRQGLHRHPYATSELTPRQREVAALLARGYNRHQIAQQLMITPRTTQEHMQAIYRKFGVETQTQVMAITNGSKPFCVPDSLTKRQTTIIQLLATGKSNQEIARELTISRKTVLSHLRDIYARLGVVSRAAAVAQCIGY